MSFSAACLPNDTTTARKRTREECESEDWYIDRRPFCIRHDSTDPFAKPRTFTPICLLPRSRLPLACLDIVQDGSRIFSASIACLEVEDEEVVLIVEEEKEERMYGVERVERRRYALCRLGEGLNVGDLMARRSGGVREGEGQRKRRVLETESGKPWWVAAAVDVDSEQMVTLKRDVPRVSMLRKQGTNTATARSAALIPESIATTTSAPAAASDPLEDLAKAYLDALYLSRTPIAYFVKGPLARARAAFSLNTAELVAFLRTSILSTNVSDKKYRESIAEHIKALPPMETPESKPKSKKKRKWKPKRDKYGFFANEKNYVEQWWRNDDDPGTVLGSAEKIDAAIRQRSQRLRSRETFLQVVLILETMALEASAAQSPTAANAESQNLESQDDESQATAGDKKPRNKKELDISALLDALLDCLNIWRTIDFSSPVKTTDDADGKDESSDELKSFASEVIIPFFSARIPEQAYAASRKLGGPKAPQQSKSKMSAPRKPGEPAVRRPPAKKPREPFARGSSDTLNRATKRPHSLHRAATDSDTLSTMIKREMSSTPPLDSIPMSKQRSQQRNQPGVRKRPSLLESLARREVDLTAISQANEAKLKKKAEVEEKVRDAINTLKKPNRARAVEEHAKTTDKSFANAVAKGKSNSYAQRKTSDKNAVAVTATPRHVRATPAPKRHIYQGPDYSYGTGGVSIVPGTSARQLAQPGQILNSNFAVPQTNDRPRHGASLIDDTPSRGFAKFMPQALTRTPGTLLESPTATRKSQIQATPAKVSRMPSLMETPVAKVPGSALKGRMYSPHKSLAPASGGREDSGIALDNDTALYNALGWDDDDEYEELP